MTWYLLVLASALFLTGQDLLKKRMLGYEHAQSFIAVRFATISVLALGLLPFMDLNLDFEVVFIIYLASIVVSIMALYLTRAVRHLEITVTAPMTNMTPAFLLLFAFIFLRETPGVMQIVGISMLIIGAYILEIRHDKHSTFQPIVEFIRSKYMHYLLGAIIGFALLAVFEKYLITNLIQPLTYIFLLWAFMMLNFMFIHWYRFGLGELKKEFITHKKGYVIGAVFSILASVTYLLALATAPVTSVIPLRRSSTLFTTLIGGRMFRESNGNTKILACMVMILGAYLVIAG